MLWCPEPNRGQLGDLIITGKTGRVGGGYIFPGGVKLTGLGVAVPFTHGRRGCQWWGGEKGSYLEDGRAVKAWNTQSLGCSLSIIINQRNLILLVRNR